MKNPTNSLLNSLRGKIWIATTALAFFICIFGLVSYLLFSFIISNSIYAVLVPFMLAAASVVIFGWWLAAEVAAPLERLSLMAKTLERGITSSFPSTSGSTETDEVLESLKKIGLQMQKLVASMEDVAKGNVDQLSNLGTDRLNQTFQRLLTKVAESIKTKSEFERLRTELDDLARRIESAKFTSEPIETAFDEKRIREIAANFFVLLDDFRSLSDKVHKIASRGYELATDIKTLMSEAIERNERESQDVSQALSELKKLPGVIRRISDELNQSTEWVKFTVDQVKDRSILIDENLDLLSVIRSQMQDAAANLKKLEQNVHDLERLNSVIHDVTRRMNILFLSRKISATDTVDTILSEETEDLLHSIENLGDQFSTLKQALRKQIDDTSNLLESSANKTAKLTEFMLEVEEVMDNLQRHTSRFMEIQEKIVNFSNEQAQQMEQAFQLLIRTTIETESSVENLKNASLKLGYLIEGIKELQQIESNGHKQSSLESKAKISLEEEDIR